jgi:predicted transcriptional regulator
MSLAIGVVGVAVARGVDATGHFDLVATACAWFGGINVVLALFNLLPGAPLDGGRVLTAILWRRSGDEHLARRRAGNAGRAVGFLLMALGVAQFAVVGAAGLWTALVGWLIISMARMEMRQNELTDALAGVTVADVMTGGTVAVSDRLSVAEFMSGPWRRSGLWPFPIVDGADRPLGLVTLERVTDVAPHLWSSTPLIAVAVPAAELDTASPDDPLLDVLRARQDPHAGVLVTRGGRLVGVLRPSDVNRAVEGLVRGHASATPPPRPPLPPPPPAPRGWARHG